MSQDQGTSRSKQILQSTRRMNHLIVMWSKRVDVYVIMLLYNRVCEYWMCTHSCVHVCMQEGVYASVHEIICMLCKHASQCICHIHVSSHLHLCISHLHLNCTIEGAYDTSWESFCCLNIASQAPAAGLLSSGLCTRSQRACAQGRDAQVFSHGSF